jgi:hypothetical protein
MYGGDSETTVKRTPIPDSERRFYQISRGARLQAEESRSSRGVLCWYSRNG